MTSMIHSFWRREKEDLATKFMKRDKGRRCDAQILSILTGERERERDGMRALMQPDAE